MKYTYARRYRAKLVYRRSGEVWMVVIPDQVANNQAKWDGHTFRALLLDAQGYVACRRRVRLDGAAYGLGTPGTGDMVVRPA